MATRVPRHPTPFPMDRGIEKIVRAEDVKDVNAGAPADLSPAFSPTKPRLEQLYAMPNLEDYLVSQLAPLMMEAGLLLPNRFSRALRDGEDELKIEEDEDPRNARVLRAARRLMRDQVALRELVQMYRNALLQG